MTYEPHLRLRRRQPRILGNVLAICVCLIWTVTCLAWGLMPGPAPEPEAPGVDVVNTAKPCDPTDIVIPPRCKNP